jgi:hypothetical protein
VGVNAHCKTDMLPVTSLCAECGPAYRPGNASNALPILRIYPPLPPFGDREKRPGVDFSAESQPADASTFFAAGAWRSADGKDRNRGCLIRAPFSSRRAIWHTANVGERTRRGRLGSWWRWVGKGRGYPNALGVYSLDSIQGATLSSLGRHTAAPCERIKISKLQGRRGA